MPEYDDDLAEVLSAMVDRIEALEKELDEVKIAMVRSIATSMVQSVRLEAFQKAALEALEKLGFRATTHSSLLESLREQERRACEGLLASVSDADPRLATTLKEIIDRAFKN